MSEERKKSKLVDLTLTFDGERQEPNRFKADPNDPTRPDPKSHAPSREHMTSAEAAELVRVGNEHYAAFIYDCRVAGGAKPETIPGLPCRHDHRLFLNVEEVGIGGVAFQNPYAAVIGCIDARVPVELITGQAANDTFVIRTAGNTLTGDGESSGSLRYILSVYGRGSGGAHDTVTAVFVFGHTKCGAVKAAYDAFKPGGTGVGGMHPSLANILREIKVAVDLVLQASGSFANEDEIRDAISYVNAVLTARRAEQMASDLGVSAGVKVYWGCYHVDDFLIRGTNFPKQTKSRTAAVAENKGTIEALALDETGAPRDAETRKALLEDAIDFAKRR